MEEIAFSELMGEHVLSKVKSYGHNVKIYSLAKILNPECAEIGNSGITDMVLHSVTCSADRSGYHIYR